jgi:hypothetical protein
MRTPAALLLISLAFLGCKGKTSGSLDADRVSTETGRGAAAGVAATPAASMDWAAATASFTPDERYVLFSSKAGSTKVDLRGRAGVATAVPGQYHQGPSRVPFDLSWENNGIVQDARTFGDGRFAPRTVDGREVVEDLDTGVLLPDGIEASDTFFVRREGATTIVRTYGGVEHRFGVELSAFDDEVLVGDAAGGEATVIAHPVTGRSMTLPGPRSRLVAARRAGPEHVLALRATGDDKDGVPVAEVHVLDMAAGRTVAVVPRLGLYELRPAVSGDAAYAAWAERAAKDDSDEKGACRVATVSLRTGASFRTPPRPCPDSVDVPQSIEGGVVSVLGGGDVVSTYDARTGRLLGQRPRAKAHAGGPPTPIRLALFQKDLAALRSELMVDAVSPLVRDQALYEKKHGYRVVGMGDAKIMLVARGREHSFCDMETGASCAPAFAADGEVTAVFSPSGKACAVTGADWGAVWDAEHARLRWTAKRPAGS